MLVRRQSSVVKSMCQTSVVLNSRGRVGTHACTLLRGDGRCSGVLVAHKFQRKSLRACPFGASLRVKGQSLRLKGHPFASRDSPFDVPSASWRSFLRVKGTRRPFDVPSASLRHPIATRSTATVATASPPPPSPPPSPPPQGGRCVLCALSVRVQVTRRARTLLQRGLGAR